MLLLTAIVCATDIKLAEGLNEPCMQAEVPVINVSSLLHGRWDARAVARELVSAARNGSSGFFTITGHDMGASMAGMQRVAKEFFSWPVAHKHVLAPKQFNNASTHTFRGYAPATVNGKEILDWTNPAFSQPDYLAMHHAHNNSAGHTDAAIRAFLHEPMPCPKHRPELCVALASHWERMQALGQKLLRGLAIGMGDMAGRGDADADFFDSAIRMGEPLSCLRFNFYPHVSADGSPVSASRIDHQQAGLACEAHRDMTLLTLLDQGDVGGLQIFQRGAWRDVPVTPGALVVNLGGGLQRWTNDVLVATSHRVRLVDAPRVSIPFFVEAAYDSPMRCIPSSVSADRPCAYEDTEYGQYIYGTFKLFKEYASRVRT